MAPIHAPNDCAAGPAGHKRSARLAVAVFFAAAVCCDAVAAAGDAAAGQAVFRLCASCHDVGPSARAGFGPQLDALFGRRAGSTADFKYSEALQRSNIVWSDATLADFVRNPTRAVPGTKMRFYGLDDDRKIADLIAYLRTFQPPVPTPAR